MDQFVRKSGPEDEKARRDWLKNRHGLGTNSAWWIAERARDNPDLSIMDDDAENYLKAAEMYVKDMFAEKGGKAGLRPLYDKLLELGLSIGPQAKACPCKTIVPLYRNHVFAQIEPTTRTRIDLGFALADLIKQKKKLPARLLDTGGFQKKDRITHRIEIQALKDINADVNQWLKTAYELDG